MNCEGPCLNYCYNTKQPSKSNNYIYFIIGLIIGILLIYFYFNKVLVI
jgi:hypothetical protein